MNDPNPKLRLIEWTRLRRRIASAFHRMPQLSGGEGNDLGGCREKSGLVARTALVNHPADEPLLLGYRPVGVSYSRRGQGRREGLDALRQTIMDLRK